MATKEKRKLKYRCFGFQKKIDFQRTVVTFFNTPKVCCQFIVFGKSFELFFKNYE
jgi:hypothetical protein